MHTIWIREHNRIEADLHDLNPHWSGERLFQETRRIVIALFQNIVYNEYLPNVLGPRLMRQFNLQLRDRGFYDRASSPLSASPSFTAALR